MATQCMASRPFRVSRGATTVRRGRPYGRRGLRQLIVAIAISLVGVDVTMAQSGTHDDAVQGIIKPVHQAALSTELQARVVRIGAREGESFKTGDLLIEFDCTRQHQELAALVATQQEMEVTVQSNTHLVQMGAGNRNDVEIARARIDRARAEVASMKARLTQCSAFAPFDGSVVELSINAHEYPVAGRPFMVLIGRAPLEVELIVPSRLMSRVRRGARIDFHVDESRRSHVIEILRLSGAVDGVSQTTKVYAGFTTGSEDVLPGMSGTGHLLRDER